MTEKIECPFCDFVNEVEWESLCFQEDKESEVLCRECEKEFLVSCSISFSFAPHDID